MSNPSASLSSALRGLYLRVDHIVHELAKFGVVGFAAFIVDIGVFNALMGITADGPLHDKPLTAKIVSVTVATTVAYFGNRYWTFRNRGRTSMRREYVLFFVLNVVGLFISVGCLWLSHYALGLTGKLADNISANGIGLVLGTTFRFWSYRRWVFPADALAGIDDDLMTRSTPVV